MLHKHDEVIILGYHGTVCYYKPFYRIDFFPRHGIICAQICEQLNIESLQDLLENQFKNNSKCKFKHNRIPSSWFPYFHDLESLEIFVKFLNSTPHISKLSIF